MQKVLFGLLALIILSAMNQTNEEKPPTQATNEPNKDTCNEEEEEEEIVAPEDQLLADVGLTFDFLANRIGRKMRWDDQGNLCIYGENSDTVFLSKSWTTPRMIVTHHKMEDPKEEYMPSKGYIQNYAPIAVKLYHESGIPPSIKMAQAIHESGWGKGGPATKGNNHFGIKCQGKHHHEKKNGKLVGELLQHCLNFHDDHPNDMFRWYSSVEESYYAHNELLLRNLDSETGNYGHIWKDIPITKGKIKRTFHQNKKERPVYFNGRLLQDNKSYSFEYWEWMAIELRNEGYATDKHYATKIAKTIRKHKLYLYDKNVT